MIDVNACQINENTEKIEVMRTWISEARKFRVNYIDNKQQDIRKCGVMR